MTFRTGDLVGNYRLEELIGEGGSECPVYRATDRNLDRTAALKILPAKYATDPDFRRRFLREAQLAARLGDEQHVVPVYDFGEAAGSDGGAAHLYLAMKYIDGPDLATYIRRHRTLDLYETCVLIGQVAEALDAAHVAGLVHRDVKPGNIFVGSVAGRPVAYVGDFGSALRLDVTSMTTSLMTGTPQYLAPERWTGGQPSALGDVYALGCVAYACLTGHAPFDGDGTEQLAYAHQHLPPPRLSTVHRHLSPTVDRVLARAIAKNPDDRYQTCGEFAAELKQAGEFLHDAPTPLPSPLHSSLPTPPPSAPPLAVRQRRLPSPRFAVPAAAVAVALLAWLAGSALSEEQLAGRPIAVGPGSPDGHVSTKQLAGPDINALAADAEGNLYFANRDTSTVRKLTPDGRIVTVAGGHGDGFSGDGGQATDAKLDFPHGLAVDRAGNLYIADTSNNRIRKVDPAGTITTVAGTGNASSAGDTGPAARATLDSPTDVAVDDGGRLYVAEVDGRRVRMIDRNGRISTVAGTGTEGFSGDGGPATQAELSYPIAVVAHSGNLYIADAVNRRIRRVDQAGTITTVAGNGNEGVTGDGGLATGAELNTPDGIAVGPDDALYIADHDSERVRRVDATGIITTFAGTGAAGFSGDGGPAAQAQLAQPDAVLAAEDGSVYVADTDNQRIRRITPDGTIDTITGNAPRYPRDGGPAVDAFLSGPQIARADDDGVLYIADSDNHGVRKVGRDGEITTIAGTGIAGDSGDGGPGTKAQLDFPSGVAVDSKGNLYIADSRNDRVRRVDPNGIITTVAGTGDDGVSADGGQADRAELSNPVDVVVDKQDNIYVVELNTNRVRRIDRAGVLTTVAGNGTEGFSGDGGPATAAQLASPAGVHVTPDGTIYIADLDNARIRKVTQDGIISTIAGSGTTGSEGDGGPATAATLDQPTTVSADDAGNVYIADSAASRIRRIDPNGTISTFAGTGTTGTPDDDEAADDAHLDDPAGISVAGNGRVYITDADNEQVYVVTDGKIRTVAGSGS